MAGVDTIHVFPAAEGGWEVHAPGTGPSSVHPTQGLAVARAWEMVGARTVAEVIVHGRDGTIQSNMFVCSRESSPDGDFLDDAGEELLRRAAMSITPGRADLRALIGRLPASSIDYSQEDDDLPC